MVCPACYLKWTRDQKHLFFSFENSNGNDRGTTLVIPLRAGAALPNLPNGGVESIEQLRSLSLPGARVLDRPVPFPGTSSSTYAFQRRRVQRNLYQLSLAP